MQSSSVNSAGNGTVTIVEENAVPSGVQVLKVANWNVTYDGFPYVEWLTTAGMIVTTPTLPSAQVSRPYSARLTAAGGKGADRWAVTAGSLPSGLALSAAGVLSGTISAATASGGDLVRSWPFTVTATDAKGAAATADLKLTVNGAPDAFYYDSSTGSLRGAQWTADGWAFSTLDGSASTLAGHTDGRRRAGVERGRDRRRADGVLLGLDHQLAAGRLAGRRLHRQLAVRDPRRGRVDAGRAHRRLTSAPRSARPWWQANRRCSTTTRARRRCGGRG